MTIEQLQSEKRVLKERIEEALREFYKNTGLKASGRFEIGTEYSPTEWNIERTVISTSPVVTINPIEI